MRASAPQNNAVDGRIALDHRVSGALASTHDRSNGMTSESRLHPTGSLAMDYAARHLRADSNDADLSGASPRYPHGRLEHDNNSSLGNRLRRPI